MPLFTRKAPTETGDLLADEYRRVHLYGAARSAVLYDQPGPTFGTPGGTVSATQEELDRVLGEGWRERAEQWLKAEASGAGMMGTTALPWVAPRV